ncbi:hypothetical protein Tco_0553288 [Tanacetum coccineum]
MTFFPPRRPRILGGREELHNFADEVHRMLTVIRHDIVKLIASVFISLHLFFLFHNLCPDEHELERKGKHTSSHISFNQTLSRTHIASEEHKDDIQPSKKLKITIIPPKQLFIDLTNEDTITPSPKLQESSPSAPNVPSKTPSTKYTSSFSIDYTLKSPTLTSSPSTNGYLNPPLSPPPRVPPPPPTQEPNLMEITLSLLPITPLNVHHNLPSLSPPIIGHPIHWNLLEAHDDSCLCCVHNRTLIFRLRDELQYMFSYIEHMLSQPPTTIIPPPPPSSPN